jgi:FKBP-type peptidyl-prolyl cis-trans isomerase
MSPGTSTDAPVAENAQPSGEVPPTDKVEGQDIVVGTGRVAEPNTQVTIEYIGQLQDGTVFDASERQGQPLVFVLGAPGIIPGFQIGVNGMKEGGERAIYIPPTLAYGDQQVGEIPPNSPLIFRLKLVKVENAPAAPAQ